MVECDPSEPLTGNDARRAIRGCLKKGSVIWTRHAKEEMKNRDLTEPDIVNTLRCGRIDEEAELVNFHWRYRIETERIAVIVTFEPEAGEIDELIVITAWRYWRRGI
jgi:hypothetical protein